MKKITLLIALLCTFCASAQWTTDTAANTLVANSTPTGVQSLGTSTGKTFVVFWKEAEAPVNFELRVQLIDEDGVQQFGPDGMLISNTIPMSSYTSIWKLAIDSKDNLYVSVTGTGTGTPGMIYKINTAGLSLWPNGINVGTGYVPTVLPLVNDDIIVAYWPGTKGKLQRFNPQGEAVWATPIDINPAAAYATRATIAADMYEHADGDFTVVFHTKLSFGISSLLYAQRYNSQGVAQWTEPAQLTDKQTAYNTPYSGAQDGDIVYYAFSGSHDSRFDSYVQRLNADGTVAWGVSGMDFDTNQTNFEMNTNIAFSSGSQFVWAIARYTTSAQGQNGEYIQKFDKVTGARQFTDNAKLVFPIDDNHRAHLGELHLVSDQPVFLTNYGVNNGASPTTINAVFLDESGDFILEDDILPVATFTAAKGNVFLNRPVDGYAVLTFIETKTDGQNKMYAQQFTLPEEICTIEPAAIADLTSACTINLADLTAPAYTDTCGNEVIPTTDETVFPIGQGTTTITWTYTTTGGFVATQTQNIIVNDITAPTLTLQNVTVSVNEEGNAAVTAAQFNNGSTDECGGDTAAWTWTITPENFTCDNLGEQTVTITATDTNGNVTTANATVTVEDPNNYCTTAGIGDFSKNSLSLYPNPVIDSFTIKGGDIIKSVVVYDLLGKTIVNLTNNSASISVDTKAWAKGVYAVTIETNSGKMQKLKVVKQ